MQQKTAVIVGATGFIGDQLLQLLLQDNLFETVRVLVRRPLTITHPKLDVQIVDFNHPDDITLKMGKGDVIFCCVGTTQSKVKGDKNAYRKVDYDIPINTARAGITNGFSHYQLVSAVGASTASGNFYLQLKGSVEEDLAAFPYQSMDVFRPSLLMGQRKEFRLMEKIMQGIMPVIALLFIGPLRKYKPIHGKKVAQAMLGAAKDPKPGIHVHQFDEIMAALESIRTPRVAYFL